MCSLVNLLHSFRIPFPKNTPEKVDTQILPNDDPIKSTKNTCFYVYITFDWSFKYSSKENPHFEIIIQQIVRWLTK